MNNYNIAFKINPSYNFLLGKVIYAKSCICEWESFDKNLNNTLTTNKTNYFSKIILSSNPGSHLYDTFVENETYFEKEPLDELTDLDIKFINDEGKLFDLEHSEHSFILEITEIVNDYDNSNYLLN